jgi:hypothetical protein
MIFVSSLKTTPSQSRIVQSLCILANSNLSLTCLADKVGFETFAVDPKLASLRAFLTVSTHTLSHVALLSSLVTSTAESDPPTVTNLIAYLFSLVVRACGLPLLDMTMFSKCFFLILFTLDCDKPTISATSLLLIYFFKRAIVSISFYYEIGFMIPYNLSIHTRKPLQTQLNNTHKKFD